MTQGAMAAQDSSLYERLERAAAMIREGQLARAEAELNAVLGARPREANALNLLGVVRGQQKRTDEAEKLFLRALEIAPNLVGAYLNLGQLYHSARNLDRALWAFDAASKLSPDRPDINYNLASVHVERGEYERALASVGKIPREQLKTEHLYLIVRSYLGLGRVGEAQALVAPLKERGKVSPEVAARFGVAFAERGLPNDAIEILEVAREQSPRSFAVLYNLGAIYSQKGEHARAGEFYAAALAERPDDVATLRALARVARARGEYEKALAHLASARRFAPDTVAVLYDYAWTALHLNRLNEAWQVFERLHREQPQEAGYLYALAVARLMNGEPEQAQTLINRYIELKPKDARGHFVLGASLFTRQHLKDARVALEQSIALKPYADAEYYMGRIAHSEGDTDEAVRWLERALASDPRHASAHVTLGIIRARQKNFEAARAALERGLELNPKDVSAPYQLGLVYTRLGERERAQKMFALAEQLRKDQLNEDAGLRLIDPPK
ncbi:MAG TPA: tetratricopeptide repeat protein [Pyrinomonadaceae bacterium]